MDKKNNSDEEYSIDESNLLSIKDNELFKDEDYVPYSLIRVKKTESKNSEDWNIMEDSNITLIIKGDRFNNKEKKFLRSPEGFKFIINGYKMGWRSVNKFKQNLKLK